jgi:hypothetical protein
MPAECYGSPERWLAQTTEIEDGVRFAALDRTPGVATTKIPSRSKAPGARSFHLRRRAACDWIVGVIEWSRRQRRTEMRGAIAARKTRHLDRGMDDILDDAVPAFHDQPFVTA